MRALSIGRRFSRSPGIVVLLVFVTGLSCATFAETVENFDGDSLILAWWGSDSTEPYAYDLDFGSTQHVHSGTYALKIDYDKANDTNTAYTFLSALGTFNLHNYDYLSFWVYNDGSPLWIKVRFEGESFSNAWESDWAAIFPKTRTAGADWENLVVDLSRTFFGHKNGDIDMTDIRQIMFMIEPGSTTNTGTFWLDDIELQRSPNAAPLDVFESDFYGWSAGSPFSVTNTTEEFYNDGTSTGLGQYALEVSWGPKETNYANFIYTPYHDTNDAPADRIGAHTNFTLNGNDTAELWVKSSTDSHIPILMKFDGTDLQTRTYTNLGAWQKLTWDYSFVPGASCVTTVWIFPFPNDSDDGGVMYVDDFNLTGGVPVPLPLVPTNLTTSAGHPDEDGMYSVSWDPVQGAANYELQEDTDPDFKSPASYFPAATSMTITKNPQVEQAYYYYRIRSNLRTNSVDNYGSFSAASDPAWVMPGSIDKYEVIEDFDGTSLVRAWWSDDPLAPYVYQMEFADTQQVHSGSYALKVTYDKANDTNNLYSFFSASGYFNLRAFDYLSFWVHNDGSPLRFKIRFEESWDRAWESDWGGIHPQTMTSDADWENIVLDLTRTFSSTNLDWTAVQNILFMVEPGSSNATGVFRLDDVKLWRAPNSAPLEPFESDFYGWAAGAPFTLTNVAEEFHNDGSAARGLGQRSLRVSWGPKSNDYGNFTYEPRHDTNSAPLNRIGNYPDLTRNGNGTLQIRVKSTTDSHIPILLKCDSVIGDMGIRTYTGTGEWQKLSWDYSLFDGVDDVSKIYLMPYPGMSDDGGVLYIDDVNLVGGMPPIFPTAPENLDATAMDPDTDGEFRLTWDPVDDAVPYEIQESTDPNFTTFVSYYSSNAFLDVSKDPVNDGGTYYYRVRANTPEDGEDSYGCFAADYVTVRISALLEAIRNQSYDTECAEVDNINIPFAYVDLPAYRITATHPDYFPTTIGERGPDFDDCSFTEQTIWRIGNNDSSASEFAQGGFGGSDDHYAQDHPAAGIDEDWTNFPKEINTDWMTNQYIWFTADTDEDVNLEVKIGARLTVDFTVIAPDANLEVKLYTFGDAGWADRGNRVFNNANLAQSWEIPDFTWTEGTDTNCVRLEVVQAGSTPHSWGVYDYVELRTRDQGGEYAHPKIYDDGNIIIEAISIDFWWRAPEGMTVSVVGETTTTNISDVHYFRIIKRLPDTNAVGFSQVFVLYEDGNARIEPHPPEGIDWVPFGSSVILGPTEDGDRPFVGIDTVTIYPKDLSMDIEYDEGGSSHVEMWVDREKNVVDVSDVTYDTLMHPFARFRSMWVYDGKADIDRVETADGVFPIMKEWSLLEGSWWRFFKEVVTYHNTYCPDFLIEARGVDEACVTQQAEDYTTVSNGTIVGRGQAFGLYALAMSVDGGEVTYDIDLTEDRPNTHMIVRYSDDDGGNNGDYPGNLIEVYVDGDLKDQTHSWNTGGWDEFEYAPALQLGDLSAGPHVIKIVTGPLTFGMDLDQFELISRPVVGVSPDDIATRQAESFDSATGVAITNLSSAVGGQAIALTSVVARFDTPCGMAVDGDEDLYIADTSNHTIRRSSPLGVVTLLAGVPGVSGSADGTGTVVRFNNPLGVAIDRLWPRTVYVADTGNHTIREIGSDGVVTTLAGQAGSPGAVDGTGSVARFSSPAGVAADQWGNVYVADTGNHTIRKITPDGAVTTFAGLAGASGSTDGTGSSARFNSPSSVAVDDGGNLYVADTGNHTIRKITPDQTVTTLAGLAGSPGSADGNGSAARFNGPAGVTVGRWWPSTVYISDTGNHTIREIATTGSVAAVTTAAGLAGSPGSADGTGTVARFSSPQGIGVNEAGRNAYVADTGNHTIRRVASPPGPVWIGTSPGVVMTIAGGAGSVGSEDISDNAQTVYTGMTISQAKSNAYMVVRYSDPVGPNKVQVYLDGELKGRFPTEHTGGWNSFVDSSEIYLGTLTAGTHQVTLVPYAGSWGMAIDQFRIFCYTSTIRVAAGRLEFAVDSFAVTEVDGAATVTVVRTGGSSGEVSVQYATGDGTATAGVDYVTSTGALVFADGVATQTFTVPVLPDALEEGNETVHLTLSHPTGGARLGLRDQAELTIMDPIAGALEFSAALFKAGEAAGAATVTVVRTGGTAGEVSVKYFTSDGTATASLDYTSTTGTLVLADGEAQKAFTVPILDDARYERDEIFHVSLAEPTGGAELGRRATAEIMILEDEMVVPLLLGTDDGSSAEFAQSNYVDTFYAATMREDEFPQELNITTWSTQDVVIVVDEFGAMAGLLVTLDVATNDGSGSLNIGVYVDDGGGFVNAGSLSANMTTNSHLVISPSLLSVGTNSVRFVAQSGSDGTTCVWWDQLMIGPLFYINHLAYVDGVDLFPQATAEQTNYTAAACAWMIGKYCLGSAFTQTQDQVYNANTTDPEHFDEITPASCASWMVGECWPPYWFATRSTTNLTHALREIVFWMDYVPDGGTNAPVFLVCGTNWSYEIARGFQTDRKPYDGGYGPEGSTYSVHGLWINDPKFNGLGYDVYVVAAEMGELFAPSDAAGRYQIVVEPPPDPAELARAEEAMAESTCIIAPPDGDPDRAQYLQSLFGKPRKVKRRGASTLQRSVGSPADPSDLGNALPYALLTDEGFMETYSRATIYYSYTVNEDNPAESYVLAACALRGPASTVCLFKMDPDDGSLRRATWNSLSGMFPPVPVEGAIWLGRQELGEPGAVVLDTRLLYDPDLDASPFFPRWEVEFEVDGQPTNVTVSQSADLSGDDDEDGLSNLAELYAGSDPSSAGSAFSLDGDADTAGGPEYAVIQWPSRSNKYYCIYRATDLGAGFSILRSHIAGDPPFNTHTDYLPQVTTYYRIEVE